LEARLAQSSFSFASAPQREARLDVRGAALNTVNRIEWSWSGPNDGSSTWSGSTLASRFSVSADGRSATARPNLLAEGDPPGTYYWSVTFHGAGAPVTQRFTVVLTAPSLAVDAISDIATSSAPYQPTLRLTGTALNTIDEIRWSWSGPNTNSSTWRRGDSSWTSRFSASSDGRSASVRPILVAANDPPGRYQWTVTFSAGGRSVTERFTVDYRR
jgi:hypothetical protein